MLPCAEFERAAATTNSMQGELQPTLAFTSQPNSSSSAKGDAKGKGTKKGQSKMAHRLEAVRKLMEEERPARPPSQNPSGESDGGVGAPFALVRLIEQPGTEG